jgi:hypothetical protein
VAITLHCIVRATCTCSRRCSLPHTFAAGAAAFLVKDVQKLQPLQQPLQQQQQQQQIKRPASASSVNLIQPSSHPHLLSRSDSLPSQPEPLSRAASAPRTQALFSTSATSAEIDTPWSPADFDAAKADILSLTQACIARLIKTQTETNQNNTEILSGSTNGVSDLPPLTRSQRFAPGEAEAAAALLKRLNYSSDMAASLLAQSRCVQLHAPKPSFANRLFVVFFTLVIAACAVCSTTSKPPCSVLCSAKSTRQVSLPPSLSLRHDITRCLCSAGLSQQSIRGGTGSGPDYQLQEYGGKIKGGGVRSCGAAAVCRHASL